MGFLNYFLKSTVQAMSSEPEHIQIPVGQDAEMNSEHIFILEHCISAVQVLRVN